MGFKGRLLFFGYPLVEILVLWGVTAVTEILQVIIGKFE